MKNIIENIKLVGEFMGMAPHNINELDGFWTNTIKAHNFDNVINLQFNSDWNWLMEVVEKIESLGYYVNITGTYVSIGAIESKTNPIFIEKDSNIKIEAVYNACVEFIKWYNSHLCSNCGRFDDVVGTHNIDTCEECALNS